MSNSDDTSGATLLDSKREFWTGVLHKLTESNRFLEFVDKNYTIGIHTDDETKTVDVLVTEKPVAVGPALTVAQIMKIHALVAKRDVAPSDTVKKILEVLGQEARAIDIASERDMQEATRLSLLKDKLDA